MCNTFWARRYTAEYTDLLIDETSQANSNFVLKINDNKYYQMSHIPLKSYLDIYMTLVDECN